MNLRRAPATILFAVLMAACTCCGLAADVPYLAGRVNDYANILSPATISDLQNLLKTHEDSTSNQVAVLTIPALEGESIEDYSIKVAQTWKLGVQGKDNGVLLLVSRDDRKVRIEVGRGLEGDLPDITCGRIIRNEIVPRFKDGDYDGGVEAGVRAILAAIQGSYVAENRTANGDETLMDVVGFLVFLFVVGIFTLLALVTQGPQSWFLYIFLLPFWIAFPIGLLGVIPGVAMFGAYAIGFPLVKRVFKRSDTGKRFFLRWGSIFAAGTVAGNWSGSGRSSSGGFLGGGGGFSGGGGSFSGGGASGGW